MLSDERGVWGGLAPRHLMDEQKGLSYDQMYKTDQQEDVLWSKSDKRVHKALGLMHLDDPNDPFKVLQSLSNVPADLAYSSYHRHSQLEALLHHTPEPRWDPLEGIDRYWKESKAEARASGDLENHRLSAKHVVKEGHVRIAVPRLEKGHEAVGIQIAPDLTIVNIVDPQAYEFGFRIGDVVQQVNRVPVYNEEEFRQAYMRFIKKNLSSDIPILFDVWRQPERSVHHIPPMMQAPGMLGMPVMSGVPGIPGSQSMAPPGGPISQHRGLGYHPGHAAVPSGMSVSPVPTYDPFQTGPQRPPPVTGQRMADLMGENMRLKQQLAARLSSARQGGWH